MVDLEGKDKGNISLPPRLQSPNVLDPDLLDEEHKLPIINMQQALYDIQISDKEKRIRRLEGYNSDLSKTCQDAEALINALDIETGDQIAQLNKQISVQADKIEETRKSMNFIEKQRREEKEVHLRKVNSVNEKYEATHIALTSAIKALNAQINTLEDYKQTREELREKLRIRDKTMAENEEQVAQILDTVDQKFKIDREKLKNELYCRLLALSGSCQIEIANAIPIPVRRLLRENIFISNELTQMTNVTLKKQERGMIMRSMESLRSNSMMIDTRNKIIHLKTVKVQRRLIEVLKKKHSNMKNRLENLGTPDAFAQEKYDDLAESARLQLEATDVHRRKLEVMLHHENVKLARAKLIHNRSDLRAKKYEETIYDLKYAVACALNITEPEEDILEMSEIQLVSHLMNIIIRGNSRINSLEIASTESIPRPSDVYTKGDLGFEPDRIDFTGPTIEKEVSEPQPSEVTFVDIPKVALVLPSKIPMEDYDDEMEQTVVIGGEGSSGTESSTASKESQEESSDSGENASPVESVADEESSSESKESVAAESDGEKQE